MTVLGCVLAVLTIVALAIVVDGILIRREAERLLREALAKQEEATRTLAMAEEIQATAEDILAAAVRRWCDVVGGERTIH